MSAPLPFPGGFDPARPFALIAQERFVTAYQGPVSTIEKMDDIHALSRAAQSDVIFVLPYRTIRERGCAARGEEPILVMAVERSLRLPRADFAAQLPNEAVTLDGAVEASVSDADFAALVARFQRDVIEKGLCSQATLSRRFEGRIADFTPEKLLSLYKRLLAEPGPYMSVLFAAPDANDPARSLYLLAGTPERHLTIAGNETVMNPIAGTLRKEDPETFPARLDAFLRDPKEVNELFQVLDEEMKMMGAVCPKGGVIEGPFLREVGAVVHTEYRLVGRRSTHAIDALRATLHAPTVVGSPLVSAARLIAEFEPDSRRYYAGEIGIYSHPRTDVPDGDIDSAILIRGAEIRGDGRFFVQAGGGIVRDSDPENEAHESRAKAMGILRVLTGEARPAPALTVELAERAAPVLAARNAELSAFWQADQGESGPDAPDPALKEKSVTIINNEDDFAYMLAHMIRALGVGAVRMVDTFAFDAQTESADLVLLGPGPGDPMDMDHPRMRLLQDIIGTLKDRSVPLLGICLGHQALAVAHGLPVTQQTRSTQGMPRTETVRGTPRRLGFYNSFSPVLPAGGAAELDTDCDAEGRIIALSGPRVTGYQFHPESVMSPDGALLLGIALNDLLAKRG